MVDNNLAINVVIDNKIVHVPYTDTTTAEDVCILVCKQLGIGPITRHLFSLCIAGKQIFLTAASTFGDKNPPYDLRIRYKVVDVFKLKDVDRKAYDYYFHQARSDVLYNKIPDLVYEKYKRELIGLGITDMYRVMLEKDIPKESVQNDYKTFIPKEVVKHHTRFFIKKPIRDTLDSIKRAGHDAWYVKAEYLKQLERMAPEYLAEEYKALMDQNGAVCDICVRVSPYSKTEPGIKIYFDSKRESSRHICTIDELCYISVRKDGTVEISRKNGIPFYLKFNSVPSMLSFVSLLDGHYRLSCKWIFNLCKDVYTPSLQKLYSMKCHGPVGGEFSYAKLEDKRSNHPGCFILRESETKYNIYYIDLCMKDSLKPKTFKLERLMGDEFIFNDDLTRYKSIQQLIAAYSDPDNPIYLRECLPPSEYDKSPLLLCQSNTISGDSLTDSSSLHTAMPSAPLCINSNDIQVYKGKKCLKWNKARSKVKFKDTYVKQEKFPKEKFTDENLSSAKKSCRNPDGDIGGPWCFVEIEDTNEVERDYCDVPFCDEEDCTLFTKNHSIYSHYARFNQTFSNLTFGIRLWDSDSFLKANARLILTILALPLTGKQIEDTGIGIEIFLSNTFTGLKYGNKDDLDFESSPGIIKSTEYTFFSVGWGNGFITLTKMGETKPLFLAEYKTKNNLLGHAKDSFYFYSAQGTDIIWSFPFCDDDDACEVHTTVTSSFQWFWLLRETNVGHDLHFYVRAFQWANILLVTTPAVGFPRIEIVLDGSDNQTRVVCTEFANGPKTILKEIPLKPLINYWKWSEFSFSLFAETLQIYLESDVGTHMIMEVKHALVKTMRWFSVSSHNNIAHWTFYCRPPQFANPPQAWLPNCALNQDELDYKGRQSVTHTGVPCLPWSAVNVLPKNIGELPLKTLLTHINYCRDLTHENKGTYCYVMQEDSPDKVEKHYCLLRKCKSVECRMAGTGNDYVGMLNVTRSNRTCHNWLTFVNNTNHSVNPDFLNNTLYADMSIQMAENYCRNPMRNVAGSWCYTTDLDIPDICNVRDCDMPEECIVIVRGNGEGRQTYILPQWKETGIHGGLHFALKEWNPDLADGIIFEIRPLTGDLSMKLMIGAENNEKMVLYYQSEIVKEKTLPHIIPAGKWVLFWLQIRKGEILLGYEGIPNSIFEWKHNTPDAFEPVFLSYRTMQGNAVGVFFKCDDCHSEITTSKHLSRIMPIGLWSETEHPVYTKLTLNVRGTGTLFISLMVLPATGNYYSIILGDLQTNIYFVKHNQKTVEVLKSGRFNESLFTNNSWTKFKIKFSEFSLNITRNSSLIFTHSTSNPMYFYWFSIGAENGPITWTANCDPPDIDGRPLDGGWSHWSPWQCTVSCGGGEGFRTRTCSNPRPNIFGKLCEGSPTSTGVCNDFECGDLSPETLNKIRDRLQTQQFSLVVSEGKPVLLENDRYLLDIITEESPESYYEWTLNGIFVVSDDTRIKFQYDNIFIKSVEISDMGVYVCMLRRINDERLVFRVISLAVTTDYYRISTRATLEFTLLSNAVVLAYVYSDLSQKWLLNNKVYLDYGISTLAAISSEHIKNISQSHSGEWRCIIQQEDLGLEWTTNVIKVNVNSAPNMYTHLMEDALTAPIFARLKTERNVFIAIIAIIVGVCSLVIIFVIVYFKFCTLPKTKAVSK